jgi:hypothetical protein
MSRLLILLCMFGWALHIVHTNSSGGTVVQKAFAASSRVPQAAAPSILQPIATAAVQSPHAITPDETPRPAPEGSPTTPPQIQTTDNIKLPSEAEQDSVLVSSQDPGEQFSVTQETGIRSGPSASAQLIGRAHAGATLRIKSREAGWVQFAIPLQTKQGGFQWLTSGRLMRWGILHPLHPPHRRTIQNLRRQSQRAPGPLS